MYTTVTVPLTCIIESMIRDGIIKCHIVEVIRERVMNGGAMRCCSIRVKLRKFPFGFPTVYKIHYHWMQKLLLGQST